jgi:hypothetical protein
MVASACLQMAPVQLDLHHVARLARLFREDDPPERLDECPAQ